MPAVTLCVNIDHIATLRQQRKGQYPDLLEGARVCEASGAHGITVHLREDRRHIQDRDVFALADIVQGKFNLEMALSDEIISIAKKASPGQVTLVPEKRQELTTEGGLDVKNNFKRIKQVAAEFRDLGIVVSLFIEPDREAVGLSKDTGAEYIEFHTGAYCEAYDLNPGKGAGDARVAGELERIYRAAEHAKQVGIGVNAGHGINYYNIAPLLGAPGLEELNIGYSIISRSIFAGLSAAVKEMLVLMQAGEASHQGARQ